MSDRLSVAHTFYPYYYSQMPPDAVEYYESQARVELFTTLTDKLRDGKWLAVRMEERRGKVYEDNYPYDLLDEYRVSMDVMPVATQHWVMPVPVPFDKVEICNHRGFRWMARETWKLGVKIARKKVTDSRRMIADSVKPRLPKVALFVCLQASLAVACM